jgi:AcrR family transcriptional regulator
MSLESRREQYRESLRQEILDAARESFSRDGYEATSIRRIADKLGCSPGILYHYFEDKPAIMAQLVRETFAKLREHMTTISDDEAPVLDRLRRSLRAYIDFGIEHPHHYGVLFRKPESPAEREKIIPVFQESGMLCFSCLRRLCWSAVEQGLLRPELADGEEVAQALWAGIHGMVSVLTQCDGFPFVERNLLIDRQVDILMAGIRRNP